MPTCRDVAKHQCGLAPGRARCNGTPQLGTRLVLSASTRTWNGAASSRSLPVAGGLVLVLLGLMVFWCRRRGGRRRRRRKRGQHVKGESRPGGRSHPLRRVAVWPGLAPSTDAPSAATLPPLVGSLPGCEAWNSIVQEQAGPAPRRSSVGAVRRPSSPITPGRHQSGRRGAVPTGVAELDRVLAGGLVPGSVTLVGGEPGIGKSTLLLQALAEMARRGVRGLLVSAEESPAQVRRRAERLEALVPGLWLVAETAMPGIQAAVEEIRPDVLVIDSVQTVWDPDLDSGPGSVVQVRGCAHRLAVMAKAGGPTTILVGHVTKEGTWPARESSSTWWTRCFPSKATGTTPCGCCGR